MLAVLPAQLTAVLEKCSPRDQLPPAVCRRPSGRLPPGTSKSYAEHIQGLTSWHARRTPLGQMLIAIALALAGWAGPRRPRGGAGGLSSKRRSPLEEASALVSVPELATSRSAGSRHALGPWPGRAHATSSTARNGETATAAGVSPAKATTSRWRWDWST